MKKSNKGFTLVELIVVIAIIGVLAAILVPSLMGYVSSSKVSTANSNAKQVYTAAATVATKMETAGTPIMNDASADFGNIGSEGTNKVEPKTLATCSGLAKDKDGKTTETLASLITANLGSGSDIAWVVTFKDGAPEGCLAAKTNTDLYVGSYPKEAAKKCAKNISSGQDSEIKKGTAAEDVCK